MGGLWVPVALFGAALSLAHAAAVAGGGWKAGGFVVAASNCAVVALILAISALGLMGDDDGQEEEKEEEEKGEVDGEACDDIDDDSSDDETRKTSLQTNKTRIGHDSDDRSNGSGGAEVQSLASPHVNHLLVLPAECNFDGVRHCYREISRRLRSARQTQRHAQNREERTDKSTDEHRWWLLLDAAKLAATSELDLSDLSSAPDMVTVSFYKLFGYPTGEILYPTLCRVCAQFIT